MEYTKSQRIVKALQELDQFAPYSLNSGDQALHVLTGALVSAHREAENSDIIKLKFPGGPEHRVIGTMYLNLQILESAAHELHKGIGYSSPIAKRVEELSQNIWKKHDLV